MSNGVRALLQTPRVNYVKAAWSKVLFISEGIIPAPYGKSRKIMGKGRAIA